MSPFFMAWVIAPRVARSSAAAGTESLRDSNTPTMTQALRAEPGARCFVLNSTANSFHFPIQNQPNPAWDYRRFPLEKQNAGMIFQRELLRELSSTAVAVFLVLIGIVVTTQLVRFLALAAGGSITSASVAALLALTGMSFLPVLLSITLFVSVLWALSRAYRDSEMMVWHSCGLPLTGFVRPVLMFTVPMVLVIALLALLLSPWAASKAEEYRKRLDSRDDASMIIPGVFRESKQADRVFFVEEVSTTDNRVSNVFVSDTRGARASVVVARKGYQETTAHGDKHLVLENGRRYEGAPGRPDFRVFEFERYTMRVEAREAVRAPGTKFMSTLDLIAAGEPRHLGELSWRIGVPVSALLLALLAIPLAYVNPRAGRSMNLVIALLMAMIYINLLSVVQAYIAQSRVPWVSGTVLLHVAGAIVVILLFMRRQSVRSPYRLLRL
jgi:lipopolysaccharide export system permease protein